MLLDFRGYLQQQQLIPTELVEQLVPDTDELGEPVYYQILRLRPDLEGVVWQGLAEFLNISLLDVSQVHLDLSLARLIPASMAIECAMVPLRQEHGQLEIALADPRQFEKCDEYAMMIAQQSKGSAPVIIARLAKPSDITSMTRTLYGIGADTVEGVIDDPTTAAVSVIGPEVVDLTAEQETGQDAAIIRFVNQLLLEAVKIKASDIHLEPLEKELQVRYRVDGVLQRETVPPRIKNLEAAIISRLKIMANLDIAEKRLPQDGQIRLSVLGRPIDVRVSIVPGMFGQGVALRILDRTTALRSLDSLGMPGSCLEMQRQLITLPHGVFLVTGPTGSGKTTTLYATIKEINAQLRKIITVEDPIEYQLDGVTQIQVRDAIGLSFQTILRHILRHDPDVIMVGEIRDTATAQIAISAAMTGHLVLTTLHTNDAPSATVRLLEMGVEPYLVASSIEAVLAQRLIRVLCPHCKTVSSMHPTDDDAAAMLKGTTLYEPRGCYHCRQTGYSGRTGIFEMFALDQVIRQMILERAETKRIHHHAVSLGMKTLRQSGLEKVGQGLTDLGEVYRVARSEHDLQMSPPASEKE